MLKLLLQRIKVVSEVAGAISGLMEQLLKLNSDKARCPVALGRNQMNHLIETAAGGFKCLMGDFRPALLDLWQETLKAIPKAVGQILGVRRRIG